MAETGRGKTIAAWVLSVLLALLFVFAGSQKLMGASEPTQNFAQWGYPAWFRVLIGLIEVAGGIALLVPSLTLYAAGALGAVMFGAIYTHITKAAPGVPVPIVCLIILAFISFARRPAPAT